MMSSNKRSQERGVKQSDEERFRQAVQAMEKGDKKAKTKVALYKLTGFGGARVDPDEAVVLLEERAKERDVEAQWMLGVCLEYGIGTEQDIKRAELLYQRSNEKGSVIGKFLLENNRGGRGTGVIDLSNTIMKFSSLQ